MKLNMMKKRNIQIAIDGFDGTGKTTLINSMIDRYSDSYTTSVERLIPTSVALFKRYANNTRNYVYKMSDQFRVMSYLWESYLRLELNKNIYEDPDLVFFDRWIFTNLTIPIDFGVDKSVVSHLIATIPKPDVLFLVTMNEKKIIENLNKKNDWMLSFYERDDLLERIKLFYEMYEKHLVSYEIPFVKIDGNHPIEVVEQQLACEMDKLLSSRMLGGDYD